jgi:hypothetical protein
MTRALGGVDLDLVAAATGNADVAGKMRQVERRCVADFVGLRHLLNLLGALARFRVALEPAGAGTVFRDDALDGHRCRCGCRA